MLVAQGPYCSHNSVANKNCYTKGLDSSRVGNIWVVLAIAIDTSHAIVCLAQCGTRIT